MIEYLPYILAPIGSVLLYGLAGMIVRMFKRKP